MIIVTKHNVGIGAGNSYTYFDCAINKQVTICGELYTNNQGESIVVAISDAMKKQEVFQSDMIKYECNRCNFKTCTIETEEKRINTRCAVHSDRISNFKRVYPPVQLEYSVGCPSCGSRTYMLQDSIVDEIECKNCECVVKVQR